MDIKDLNETYLLAKKAMAEYYDQGNPTSPCPNCGNLPIVEILGIYGETFTIKCPCGYIYLIERGI